MPTDRRSIARIARQGKKNRVTKGATAYWWILKDEPALSQNSGSLESRGHVAALYKDELYEMQVTRAGTARLQQFGVILGYKRVVIYVEPHADEHLRVTTNTARTTLMINNEPLPWADWAAEFREKMPSEIAELVNDSSADTSAEDFSKSIHERLKQILDLYKVSRYRSTPDGALAIDMDALVRGNQPRTAEYKPSGNGTLAGGKKGSAAGGAYSAYLKKGGAPGEQLEPNLFPEVKWVTVKDGTREPPYLDDRAANYLIDQNVLIINGDSVVEQTPPFLAAKNLKDFISDELVRSMKPIRFKPLSRGGFRGYEHSPHPSLHNQPIRRSSRRFPLPRS